MNGTVIDQPFLDVRDGMVPLMPAYDERGLLSIAFHPNFSTNGKVYAYYSAPLRASADPTWSCTNRLSEFTVNLSSPDLADNATERILLEVDKPQMNHNGGILLFGPTDNYLYLTLGDGGRADDTGIGHTPEIGNAQDLTKLLGKVIRIDVDTTSAGREYGIPADNPFLANASIPAEIYAYGFRNPAFASFDSGGSNRMFIAMAGQNLFESVLVLYKGGAYPWNIREGTHCFDPANNRSVAATTCRITSDAGQPLIGPVVELGHDVGNTVVGGVVYRGSALPSLQGAYIFGTWSNTFTAGNGTAPDRHAAGRPRHGDPARRRGEPDAGAERDVDDLRDDRRQQRERTDQRVRPRDVREHRRRGPRPDQPERRSRDHAAELWRGLGDGGREHHRPGAHRQCHRDADPDRNGHGHPDGYGQRSPRQRLPASTRRSTSRPRTSRSTWTTITVQAGALVTVNFNNMDAGVLHNVAVYTDSSAATPIFQGATVTGPTTTTYTFTAPATPGTYFFRCDVHPTTMTGTFVVT